jgi:hypothetical protein
VESDTDEKFKDDQGFFTEPEGKLQTKKNCSSSWVGAHEQYLSEI